MVEKFFVPIRLDDQRPWPEHGKSVETVDMVFFLFAFWLLFCSPNPANRCDFGCWTSHQVPHPVWVETLPKKEQRTKNKNNPITWWWWWSTWVDGAIGRLYYYGATFHVCQYVDGDDDILSTTWVVTVNRGWSTDGCYLANGLPTTEMVERGPSKKRRNERNEWKTRR